MGRLVEQNVGLVVDAMHRVEDDMMEGQQRCAPKLLCLVLACVRFERTCPCQVIHGGELRVNSIKLRPAAVLGVEDLSRGRGVGEACVLCVCVVVAHLGAARACKAPAMRLALAERLPWRHVSAMAQIFE